jgi:sec-independent protein translocase protein TatC
MTQPRGTMPFLQHAVELRRRLIISLLAALAAAIVCYTFYEPVLAILLRPLDAAAGLGAADGGDDAYLFINTIFEGFLVRVKVALIAGAVLATPVHLYNLVRFIFPGLTRRERRAVTAILAASFVLLLAGFFYSYYSVIPLSVRFLVSAGFIPPGVELWLNFQRNVFFVFQFLLVFLLVFQIPILLVVLMMTGVVTRRALLRASRYAVVGIFALSAVVTPPDVVSQVSLAVPMVGMFFLSILVAKLLGFGAE